MSTNSSSPTAPTDGNIDSSNKDILLIVASVAMAVATVFLILIVRLLERCIPRNAPEGRATESKLEKEARITVILNKHTKEMTYTQWVLGERLKHHKEVNSDMNNVAVAEEPLSVTERVLRLGSAPKEDEVWASDCAVCLSEFVEEDLVKELACDHIFHSKCIHDWFLNAKQAACPLCRSLLPIPEAEVV